MPKLPRVTGEEAVSAFCKVGFYVARINGSHHILKHDTIPHRLSIPVHKGKTLGSGLLRHLIELAGLTVEQFTDLL